MPRKEDAMKAICVHEIGGPDVLRLEEMPNPQPDRGQVLIRQRTVAVNFIDTYFRSGLYKAPSLPFVPGVEGAGEIAALGEGVTNFQVGERVAYVANLGAYAELRVVAADRPRVRFWTIEDKNTLPAGSKPRRGLIVPGKLGDAISAR